jgi:hypothetical protein
MQSSVRRAGGQGHIQGTRAVERLRTQRTPSHHGPRSALQDKRMGLRPQARGGEALTFQTDSPVCPQA